MSKSQRPNRKRKAETVTQPNNLTASACRTPSPKRHNDGAKSEDFNADKGQADSGDKSSKVFNDSIHGHIEVHPLCVKIIDTPQFQRLRNIKQLGACYHVFPGASHNRFEHCIGTCYLAGKLVRSLQKHQPELGITEEDVLCIKIAGLCHDLGHGPFSHMFDRLFIPKAILGTDWKHEVASVNMFDHMMKENNLASSFEDYKLVEKDLIFIKELIAGEDLPDASSSQEWPFKGREPTKRYLYEIVANKTTGIDVDKFDYFSRDCHNLGIGNSFDHKRYIKFARVIEVDGNRQICVRDKEALNIYHMFHTRNSLFRRAYQHKTTNIIERMITEAMLLADKNIHFKGSNGEMFSISESIEDMEAYTLLTDQVYYQILCSSDPKLQEAQSILMRIQRRDLYKCIGQTILTKRRKKTEIPGIIQDMAKCVDDGTHIEPNDFIVDLVTYDYGMKESNPIDKLRFYGKKNPNEPMILRKDEVSSMLPVKFAEQQIRVYFRKNEPDCLEKAERCFKQWCQGQECTAPKAGYDLAEFTPMKPPQETGRGNMERRLSFSE